MLVSEERRTGFPWVPNRFIRGEHTRVVSVGLVGALLALVWAVDIFLLPNWGSYQGKILGGVFLIAIETFLICWLVQQPMTEKSIKTESIEHKEASEETSPRLVSEEDSSNTSGRLIEAQ